MSTMMGYYTKVAKNAAMYSKYPDVMPDVCNRINKSFSINKQIGAIVLVGLALFIASYYMGGNLALACRGVGIANMTLVPMGTAIVATRILQEKNKPIVIEQYLAEKFAPRIDEGPAFLGLDRDSLLNTESEEFDYVKGHKAYMEHVEEINTESTELKEWINQEISNHL